MEGRSKPKVKNFVEVIDNFTDEEFAEHFRLKWDTFEVLLQLFKSSEHCPKEKGTSKNAKEHLLAFLWYAGHKTVMRSVALLFNMAVSTVEVVIRRVTNFLYDMAPSVITFPKTEEERQEIATGFSRISRLQFVVGCIDGTYIPIRTPASKVRSTYVNRHDETSVTLQAICDHKMRFLDCFTDTPGKMHDANIYKKSFIYDQVNAMGEHYHIFGDAAYPISVNLITPYKGNLTQVQRNFNTQLSRARVKIENAFGLMKERFKQLSRLEFWDVEQIARFIITCCVLHNVCINLNDAFYTPLEEIYFPPDEFVDNVTQRRRLGQAKRDRIADELYYQNE